MLHQLAKKDSKWREIALKICKDKMLADDIVQEMYLKLANNKKQINDFYVIIVIRNLFIDEIKIPHLRFPFYCLGSRFSVCQLKTNYR